MTTTSRLGIGATLALAAFVALLAGPGRRAASQPKEPAGGAYLGNAACIRCHTDGPPAGSDEDFVLLTEYTTWRLQDKHSFAFLSLRGPRAQQMEKLLGLEHPASEEAACLSCHAPKPEKTKQGFDRRDGIGCEVCHGPAEKWLADHQDRAWRLESAAAKAARGMTDLRDPATCAAVCTSCHVGNAAEGKVVTHAMYAAGHPPLPDFELGLFRQNMPPHWREKRAVPFFQDFKNGDAPVDAAKVKQLYQLDAAGTQQARLVIAGAQESVRCAFDLAAQRADLRAADGMPRDQRERRWPELTLKFPDFEGQALAALWPQVFMGQADCYACHHDLRQKSWRQLRGYTGPPGRPQVRAGPLALPGQGVGVGDAAAEFHKRVAAVHAACNDRPYGDPAKLEVAAKALALWGRGRLEKPPAAVDPAELLQRLCKLGPDQYPDYDSARQIAAAVWVIHGEWEPRTDKGAEVRELLDKLAAEFDLQPYQLGRRERLEMVLGRVLTPKEQKDLLDRTAVNGLLALSTTGIKGLSRESQEKVRALLNAVRIHSGPDMTKAVLDNPGPFLQQLHDLNERELTQAMKRVNDYDPAAFKERLARLAALLPRPGK